MYIFDYRDALKRHLADRMEANPRYSLRAFSRDLSISPSRLSEVLNGKQGLSGKWAVRIAERLQMSDQESEEFRQRVLASDARAKKVRSEAIARLKTALAPHFHTLDLDAFKVISDWFHFALLELTKVKGFRHDHSWIARKLGISEYEAKLAVERLIRVGLVEVRRGRLRLTRTSFTTTNGAPSEAIRQFNRQLLEKAVESIQLQTLEERDISTLTVAVRKKDIPRVRELIRRFRRELNAELEASVPDRSADEVYSLAIQFFRLTTKEQP